MPPWCRWHTDKKENQIFLIYKEIQNVAYAKSYMTNSLLMYGPYLRVSLYIRKPFLICDFATASFWISSYMRKILFYFLSVHTGRCKGAAGGGGGGGERSLQWGYSATGYRQGAVSFYHIHREGEQSQYLSANGAAAVSPMRLNKMPRQATSLCKDDSLDLFGALV